MGGAVDVADGSLTEESFQPVLAVEDELAGW